MPALPAPLGPPVESFTAQTEQLERILSGPLFTAAALLEAPATA